MAGLTEDFADLVGTIRRPGDFFATGTVELLTPLLEVAGVGQVAMPLLPAQARALIEAAEPAPFGRGTATLIDPAVRNCGQIDPDRVRLGGRHWPKTLDAIVARAAEGLGVEGEISAEFYKLLVYDTGGFFVGHRDTEKTPGMFATLVVVLPSAFEGGALLLRHGAREARLDLRTADPAEAVFAAFYADCVHEVQKVTAGCRLALSFNLVRRDARRPPGPPDHTAERDTLAAMLEGWRLGLADPGDADLPEKLVYPLQHAYTPAALGFADLKGPDAAAAGVVAAAARAAHYDLHLALLTVEESGSAEYSDRYDWRAGRGRHVEDEFEVGEVFDRIVTLSGWQRPEGGAAALGAMSVAEEELSPPDAFASLDPEEQHFTEATGNEGASFERTYRRAALVLWPAERRGAVLAASGPEVALPCLEDLARRAVADAALRDEALSLAREMLSVWPKYHWRPGRGDGPSEAGRMAAALRDLDDTALIARALGALFAAGWYIAADVGPVLDALNRLAPARRGRLLAWIATDGAERHPGVCVALLSGAASRWNETAPEGLRTAALALLKALPGPPRPQPAAPSDDDDADADWLDDLDDEAWTDDEIPSPAPDPWPHRPARIAAEVVADLLTALAMIDPPLAGQAVAHMLAWPQTYGLDEVLVPAARRLFGADAAPVTSIGTLREACATHLRARIAEPLAPPADWRRDATLPCGCPRCTDLARFLADPARETWVFKAAEADRRHVEGTIQAAKSDVRPTTDRRGRPYSLVCTKTQASYDRRASQRAQDLRDMSILGG
jgi:predicted 2-oxoglutarate/Fe(II)-dependent dioxygenase YbiX